MENKFAFLISVAFQCNVLYVNATSGLYYIEKKNPILDIAQYEIQSYGPTCLTQADTPWRVFFFATSILVFFIIPCFILMVLYTLISKNLMKPAPGLVQTSSASLRYRRKVILMLGTVVISFFVLLLPFRVLTLVILFVPTNLFLNWYVHNYELFLAITYTSRILIHLNSAINPILYNLMSSKFRNGFYKLFLINRLWCEFFFCPNNVSRKNTLTNSLVTTTTTNLTSSSVIKHQYSISSVHSNKSAKKSVKSAGRKYTKKHCRQSNAACMDSRKLLGPNHQACQYCNKQVHVSIEDCTPETDNVERMRKEGFDSSARESCSSGDDTELFSQIVTAEKSLAQIGIPLENKRASDNCPVCKLFNRFQTVNSSVCKFSSVPHCTNHRQHEFCALFRNMSSEKSSDEEIVPIYIHDKTGDFRQDVEEKSKGFGGNYTSVGVLDTVQKRTSNVKHTKQDTMHINEHVNNLEHKTDTGKLDIVGIDSFTQNSSQKCRIESDNVNITNRETVIQKKLLRRSSTYDLFVENLCDVSRNKTVMKQKDGGSNETRQNKCQHNLFKHVKALSLENDYNHVHDSSRNKKVANVNGTKNLNSSLSSDQDSIPNGCLHHDTGNVQILNNCDSKHIPLGAKDFSNYVNFEAISREHVEKLVQNKHKFKNSQSLQDCFRNEDCRRGNICQNTWSGDHDTRKKSCEMSQTYGNFVERKQCCCQRRQIIDESVSNSYGSKFETATTQNEMFHWNEDIKTRECNGDVEDKAYDLAGLRHKTMNDVGLEGSESCQRSSFYQRNISETYQTNDVERKYQRGQHSKVDVILRERCAAQEDKYDICNEYKSSVKCKTQQNGDVGNNHQRHLAQVCSKSSQRRILRRKSFDLNACSNRDKLHLQRITYDLVKPTHHKSQMSRRKSCDFGQITRTQNLKLSGRLVDVEDEMRSSHKRSWSNESIGDLCSIFENPMTAHFTSEETDIRQREERRFGTTAAYRNRQAADWQNFTSESKDHKLLLEDRKPSKVMFARRSSVSSIIPVLQPYINESVKTTMPEATESKSRDGRPFHPEKIEDVATHRRYRNLEKGLPRPKDDSEFLDSNERPCLKRYVLKKRKSMNF